MSFGPQDDVGAAVIEEAIDRVLVYRFQVVDLEERIEQYLDVAGDVVARRVHVPDGVEVELREMSRYRAQVLEQRLRLGVLVDEHPVAEALAADGNEPVLVEIEANEVPPVTQVDELAFEVVGPAVVAADEAAASLAAGILDQRPAAVAARVVEGPYLVVLAANDQDRRAGFAE